MNIFLRIAVMVLIGLAALYALFFLNIAAVSWRMPLSLLIAMSATQVLSGVLRLKQGRV